MTMTSHETRNSMGGLGVRVLLTLLGTAGLIIGGFLRWTAGIDGTKLDVDAFWSDALRSTGVFLQSSGFVMIVLGLVAVLGLAIGSGWLTRLAGAVAIVGVILVGIEVYRSPSNGHLQIGAWIALAGAIVTVIAGFFGSPTLVSTTSSTQVIVDE